MHRIVAKIVGEIGRLEQVIVRRGAHAPRLHNPLPAERTDLLSRTMLVTARSHEEPHAGSVFVVVHRTHFGSISQALAFFEAGKLLRGDKRNMREVIIAGGESAFSHEHAPLPFFDEVHRALEGRLHERAIRVPARHRKGRLILMTRRKIAEHARYRRYLRWRSPRGIAREELEPLLRDSLDAVVRCISPVTADVQMVSRGVPRRPFGCDDLARHHFAPILHEDVGQVREDDVGAVTEIDVDVQTEVRRRIAVVHVRHARDRRVHQIVGIVGGVEVHVVARCGSPVGVAPSGPLAAAVALPFGEGQVNRYRVTSSPADCGVFRNVQRRQRRTAGEEEYEEHTNDEGHGLTSPEMKR